MPVWDPTQYLRHADDRARPFVDLISRVEADPRVIVDLGCGPGQLMPLLQGRWPNARLVGVDSSAEMIAAARARDDGHEYQQADASTWKPSGPVDLLVSNALFQWLPDGPNVVRGLMNSIAQIALQVPNNHDAPSHVLLREIGGRAPYVEHTHNARVLPPLDPETYLDLFAEAGWQFDVWETVYRHVLPGDDAVWDWISGTGARPWVQALPADLQPRFIAEYQAALREAYPRRPWGTVLPFRRTFAIGQRPD